MSDRPFAIDGHVINFFYNMKTIRFGKMMLAGTERAYKNWVNSKFSALHVKSSDSTEAENYKDLYGKNKSFHPVTVEWFSIQIQP